MEVITRGDVTCVPLLWQRGGGWVFTFVCKAVFDLKPGEAALAEDPDEPSDRDVPGAPPFSRSLAAIDDLVPLKPRNDVIATGHAHAPAGPAVRSLRARLAIGAVDKAIDIVADRYFDRDGLLVEGAPFSRMPLAYELAAGGPGTWNPAGLAVGTLDGLGHLALPNLIPAGLPLPTPEAPFVAPIGFGPIPRDWPSRVQKLGRRGLHDVPAHWGGAELPEDFPRDFFNAAPDDQQLAALPEDLTLTLENLIPGHPALMCWLPSITPSILCEGALGTSSIRPSIDTIHIHTDTARCSVVWRGHLPRREASDDLRVIVALENPRVRLRTSLAATGEHSRVAPPPMPAGPVSRPEPPTFSGITGEHPRVVPPPLPRTEPPKLTTTGEHVRVAVPPAPSARPTPRPALPTAPLFDTEMDAETFNPHVTQPIPERPPIPERKSEPTRLFTQTETPPAVPASRKSEPTRLFTQAEAPAIPRDRKNSPTALYPLGEAARAYSVAEPTHGYPEPPSIPRDRKSSPTAFYPIGEPPRAPEPPSEPVPAIAPPRPELASFPEIEADPEPPSEPDPFDEDDHNPRDTIAPGLIASAALPFPMPVPRPTPDSDWGSSSLGKTGMYPWGAGTEPGRNAPSIPDSRPSPVAAAPPAPMSRPAQSGHTLPPAPMPGMEASIPADLRPPPMSAALRGEVSLPTPPPPIPLVETASRTETPWETGPSGPRRETIGMAWSTAGALAVADPAYEAGFVDEPTPAPEPARTPTLLLWFDADSVVRIRRAPQWRALLDELEKVPLDRDLEPDGGTREPWELEDRRDVMEICARGHATNGKGCEEALSGARTRTGKLLPPIVLVEGELEVQLDEMESLKAAATTVAPLVTPLDEGLRSALEATDTFLRRQGLSAAPAVCEGLLLRLREAFTREKKTLPADYLDRQIERALLTGRHYQRRDVLGGPYFRAFLRVPGEKEVLVTYLPEAVHRRVPMHRRFTARLIVDVHPQQDPYETRPLALRTLALARTLQA